MFVSRVGTGDADEDRSSRNFIEGRFSALDDRMARLETLDDRMARLERPTADLCGRSSSA